MKFLFEVIFKTAKRAAQTARLPVMHWIFSWHQNGISLNIPKNRRKPKVNFSERSVFVVSCEKLRGEIPLDVLKRIIFLIIDLIRN